MRTPDNGLRETRPPPGAACDHPPGAPPTLRGPGRPSTAPLLASPHPTEPALYRQRGGWDRVAWTHLPGGTWQRVSPSPRSPGRRRRDRKAAAERGGGSRCPSNGAALATERPASFRRPPTPPSLVGWGLCSSMLPGVVIGSLVFSRPLDFLSFKRDSPPLLVSKAGQRAQRMAPWCYEVNGVVSAQQLNTLVESVCYWVEDRELYHVAEINPLWTGQKIIKPRAKT